MSMELVTTGKIEIKDDISGDIKDSYDLEKALPNGKTGLLKRSSNTVYIKDSSGAVSLSDGGASPIKGIMIVNKGAEPITFKHGGNTTGIAIAEFMVVTGAFTLPTIETASTTDMEVQYTIFG